MAAPRKFSYAEAARLYRSGLSQFSIAAKLGVNHTAVSLALRKMGVEARKSGWKMPRTWSRQRGVAERTVKARQTVPAWVPVELREIYATVHVQKDEFEAARVVRQMKEMAQ